MTPSYDFITLAMIILAGIILAVIFAGANTL